MERETQVLELAGEVMVSVFSFPYLLTVWEFNGDNSLDDCRTVVFPDNFQDQFLSFSFFEKMTRFVALPWIKTTTRLQVVKVLSRMPATRKSISRDPKQTDEFIKFLLLAFQSITNSSFEAFEAQVVDEALDMAKRLLTMYTVQELVKFADLFYSFVTDILKVAEFVFKTDYSVSAQLRDRG